MKKGLAVFSGTSAIHKLLQDGTVILGNANSGSVVQISGTLSVTGQTTLASAQSLVVGSAHAYSPETTLSGILAAIKADVDSAQTAAGADSTLLQQKVFGTGSDYASYNGTGSNSLSGAFNARVQNLEGIVEAAISGGAGDSSAFFSGINGTLNSIREIAEYLDGDGVNAATLINGIGDISTTVGDLTASVIPSAATASLNQAKAYADSVVTASFNQGSEALAAAKFTINGVVEVSASNGAFTIEGGSNLSVTNDGALDKITIDLDENVTITGKLSASNVEASSEVKGATVVSTGKMTAGNALEVTAGGLQIVAGGAQITGSVALKDGLNVSGSTTLQGAATLQSTLTVAGVAQLNGALTASAGARISALSVDGAASVDGNLSVAGTSTLTGKLTANGGIDINGNLSGSGTLEIGGAATVAGALSVGGNAAITGSLTVSQAATFNNGVSVATGSAAVEHGTLKAVMVSGVDDLGALWSAAASSNGKFFYLSGAATGGFPRGDCWYFCQNSDWFDAPFFGPEA